MRADELPTTFPPRFELEVANELSWLLRAERAGVNVTPMTVVPPAVESAFYRLNNLPERFGRLFEGVAGDDPDEDDLEEHVGEARALVLEHALLDEVVDSLYESLAASPERVVVRPAGEAGVAADRGRGALLAIKRAWADEWELEKLLARLRAGRGLLPSARAFLLHDAAIDRATEELPFGPDGTSAYGWYDGLGRLARLELAAG